MLEVSADVGNVAEDLRKMDPHLKVRFAEAGNPPFFAVIHESDDGRTSQLVTTVRAYQNASGVWEGLDQRVVRRLEEIDGQAGYDYASELERQNRQASRERRERFREQTGEASEEALWEIRRKGGL